MNAAVALPTTIIKLGLPAELPQAPARRERPKGIDFYDLIPEFSQAGVPAPILSGALEGAACDEGCHTTTDFLILSLKNDIRVRYFSLYRGFFLICFWTIKDSISFYRQYLKVAPMTFARTDDYCSFYIGAESWAGAPEASFTAHGGAQYFTPSPRSELAGLGGRASQIYKRDGDSARVAKREESLRQLECLLVRPGSPAPEAAAPAEEPRRKVFERRVGYFNKMKNFFSKNEVRKMQGMLESGKDAFLYVNTKEVACGCLSNVLMQAAVKTAAEAQLCDIIRNLGADIAAISATKYGAYSVQAIILSAVSSDSQSLLSSGFSHYGEFLIEHEIGNYAIQKILRFDDELIYGMCMGRLDELIEDDLGVRVLKRCVQFFKGRRESIAARLGEVRNERNGKQCAALLEALGEL